MESDRNVSNSVQNIYSYCLCHPCCRPIIMKTEGATPNFGSCPYHKNSKLLKSTAQCLVFTCNFLQLCALRRLTMSHLSNVASELMLLGAFLTRWPIEKVWWTAITGFYRSLLFSTFCFYSMSEVDPSVSGYLGSEFVQDISLSSVTSWIHSYILLTTAKYVYRRAKWLQHSRSGPVPRSSAMAVRPGSRRPPAGHRRSPIARAR